MKLSHQYIKQQFETNGCKLLSVYTGCHDKMDYICQCGNVAKINWHNFKMGKRCRQCANNKLRKERQFNYEYVKQIFEDNNYLIDNLELLCYNCYFLFVADPLTPDEIRHIEDSTQVKAKAFEWDLDDESLENLKALGISLD